MRAIVAEHARVYCGYDTLYVTPADKNGNQYIHVFKLLPSRLVGLYVASDLTAESLALAMFQFFTTYGVTDVLITDPGSNINSEVTKSLLSWFGVRLRMSIVGRHESNYVERTNREVLRFLSALVHSERLEASWSEPYVISTVQFLLNDQVNKETGVSPFEFVFGTPDSKYFRLPMGESSSPEVTAEYVKALNRHIGAIREEAAKVTLEQQSKRQIEGAGDNSYQPGDLVLRKVEKLRNKPSKLTPSFLGPYKVVRTYKSDIDCQHLVTGAISTFHMSELKICFATEDDAYQAALVDYQQYVIDTILNYKGDPELRTSMSFLVRFLDTTEMWLPYSRDLSESIPFEKFCRQNRPLLPLIYTVQAWGKVRKESFRRVQEVQPGDLCYVDLRAWGYGFFASLDLPDVDKTYVLRCRYGRWRGKGQLSIELWCELFRQFYNWDAFSVYAYGTNKVLTDQMILVDEAFAELYPAILS